MNLLNQKYSKEVSDIIKSSAQYPSLTKQKMELCMFVIRNIKMDMTALLQVF